MQLSKPILTITGSDSTGGSGVQADIKTISLLGGYAVSAVTSITVQNTLGIQEFHDLPASVVQGQIEAVVNDVEPQTVKIGMIRTKESLDVVVELLNKYRPRHVVYVPVTTSSQGERLVTSELAERVRRRLLPLCTLVIPNTGFDTHGKANMYASAVAHYLNEGHSTNDALARARQWVDTQDNRLRGRGRELYALFLRELETHYRTYSDVRFYAEQLNVASDYLAQVTRRACNLSPKAIIDNRILAEAERMLTQSGLTIQETAYALGFANQAHFARFFHKCRGMSPSAFRRQENKPDNGTNT